MKNILHLFLISICLLPFTACKYTLSGISIPPNVKTFYIEDFTNTSASVVPTLAQTLQEALKNKVRNESRLVYDDTDPDIEFTGNVVDYDISSIAPQPNQTSALNRLEIVIAIEFVDNNNEENDWKQNFSFFNDFPSNDNILDVQDQLINNIQEQIVEDIFNKAFTNW